VAGSSLLLERGTDPRRAQEGMIMTLTDTAATTAATTADTTAATTATRDEETSTATATGPLDVGALEAFAARIAGDLSVAYNSVQVYLGDRLGIWRALASVAGTTSEGLAERTGLAERYLTEWLSAQAAAGYLTYDGGTRTFSLPAEHAAVLADDTSPASLMGGFEVTAGMWAGVERLAHAFATGDGIGWHEQDARVFSGVERFFRPLYASSLVAQWLPAVDGLVTRLHEGIRVVDVGCGLGTATLMMAEAFPASSFTGVDYHDESIRRATYAAERTGASNVRFEQADAHSFDGGPYDAICFFDALHDMGDPVGALVHARERLAEGGVVLAVEPAASDRLEENLHPLGATWYAASTALCLPGSLSQHGQAGLGAQAGAERTLEVFGLAGFASRREVARTMFNIVYEARG
jgi:SAM-dependent methyltransferase